MAEEKILTINLRKKLQKISKWKKSKYATKHLKELLEKSVKAEVEIDKKINEKIWSKGIENPPTKLRIKITKTNDKFKAELA